MATTAIEIGTRDGGYVPGRDSSRFNRDLPAVIFEAVSKLAQEHGVVLRSVQVIERRPKAR